MICKYLHFDPILFFMNYYLKMGVILENRQQPQTTNKMKNCIKAASKPEDLN